VDGGEKAQELGPTQKRSRQQPKNQNQTTTSHSAKKLHKAKDS